MPRLRPFTPIFDVDLKYGDQAVPGIIIGEEYVLNGTAMPGAINVVVTLPQPTIYEPTLEFVGSVTSSTQLNNPQGLVASGDLIVVGATGDAPREITVLDASTPATPTIIGNDGDSNFGGVAMIELIDATHAILSCGANLGRITTVDFSVPGAASLFDGTDDDSTNFFNNLLGVAVVGTSAYVSGSGKLGTMDVSNPAAPSFTNVASDATAYANALGRRPICALDGSHVVVGATNRLSIVDVSTPTSPSVVGSYVDASHIGGSSHALDINGDIVAHVDAGLGYLTLVDVSDPTDPQLLGFLGIDTVAPIDVRDCRIVGGCVVISRLSLATLVDISDPTAPKLVDTYGSLGNCEFMCRFGSDMVALSESSSDRVTILQVVD